MANPNMPAQLFGSGHSISTHAPSPRPSPRLSWRPDGLVQRTLCGSSVLGALDELIRNRGWPRELALELQDILTLRPYGYTSAVYECPNFRINYFIDAP